VIEDLDFEQARAEGRERTGSRPSRGRRGRAYRRMAAGIPTGKLRDRLTQMAPNAGLSVIVIDPAYTSRWSAVYWLPLLREQHPETTGHHAAALVIGRRGLGHQARTRVNGNRTAPADAMRPARTRTRKPPAAMPSNRKPATPRAAGTTTSSASVRQPGGATSVTSTRSSTWATGPLTTLFYGNCYGRLNACAGLSMLALAYQCLRWPINACAGPR
jgi:hypothetical protein